MSFKPLDNLNGKITVITGGGAVARATAKKLSEYGATIILLVRNNIEELQSYLNTLGSNHIVIYVDILKTETIKQAVEIVKEKFKKCDILINTAGRNRIMTLKNLYELTDDIFDEIMLTNTRGTFSIIREFHELLSISGDSLIVNISSISPARSIATYGVKGCMAYGASKAALDYLTKALARTLAPNIRVLGIAPAYLSSGGTSGGTDKSDIKKESFLEHIKKETAASPLGRLQHPDDVANVIKSLAMDIRFATGSTFVVDGGRLT